MKDLLDDIVFVFSGLRTADILTIIVMGCFEIGILILLWSAL